MQVKLVNILTYVPILSYENGILSHNSNRHAVQYKRPVATWAPMWVASLFYYLHCDLFPDDQVDTSKLQQPIKPKLYFGKFVALEYNLT